MHPEEDGLGDSAPSTIVDKRSGTVHNQVVVVHMYSVIGSPRVGLRLRAKQEFRRQILTGGLQY